MGVVGIPLRMLVPFVVAAALTAGIYLYLARTFMGRAILAVAQDRLALQLMGADPVRVERLRGVVATVYPPSHEDHDYVKVWPLDPTDPQLPSDHDGNLWFKRSESTIVGVPCPDEAAEELAALNAWGDGRTHGGDGA